MSGEGYSRELTLGNAHGLHLRPASKFVSLANEFSCDVFVSVNGAAEGNGKSILDLSAQAAEKGAKIRIRTVGEGAEEALEKLVALVEGGFGETSGGG